MKYIATEQSFCTDPAFRQTGVAAFTGLDHVLAPSAIPSAVTQQPTSPNQEADQKLVGQFGDTARRAMEAGADGRDSRCSWLSH